MQRVALAAALRVLALSHFCTCGSGDFGRLVGAVVSDNKYPTTREQLLLYIFDRGEESSAFVVSGNEDSDPWCFFWTGLMAWYALQCDCGNELDREGRRQNRHETCKNE